MNALAQLGNAEANLGKVEKIWREMRALIPAGIAFVDSSEYDNKARTLSVLLGGLPPIDGYKLEIHPPDLNAIAETRFDYAELNEPIATAQFELTLDDPLKAVDEYRFRLTRIRRKLIRDNLQQLIKLVDEDLMAVAQTVSSLKSYEKVSNPQWDGMVSHVKQIDVLLGSSKRPQRWSDLMRHIGFALPGDFQDIQRFDWPKVRQGLQQYSFFDDEPIPVEVDDLSSLIAVQPSGPVVFQLKWESLDDEGFERLLFNLISTAPGYENPEWLMQTKAPDRGRDLSVVKVTEDALMGVSRQRVIIQCKHWLSKSLNVADVAAVKEQVSLWNNPLVDILIFATSGRFTADAISWIEQHNAKGTAPKIEMWPDSHFERLLAPKPALVAEFGLR
jgi:hypothetical protein